MERKNKKVEYPKGWKEVYEEYKAKKKSRATCANMLGISVNSFDILKKKYEKELASNESNSVETPDKRFRNHNSRPRRAGMRSGYSDDSSNENINEDESDSVEPDSDTVEKEPEELTPKEYFEGLKEKKRKITDKELLAAYNIAINMYEGFIKSGQDKAAKKLKFLINTIEKEHKLYELGVDTYVYRQDIARYIQNVSMKVVKVIELESYERPIPEEIQEVIKLTDGIFTRRVIVYTDYTGKDEKRVEKERREKDPILFGIFDDKRNHPLSDRFYFLGDWEDDKCDLTLESIVTEMQESVGETITHEVAIPQTFEEMNERLKRLNSKEEDVNVLNAYINSVDTSSEKKPDNGPAIDPNNEEEHREYRERNIGEKIANTFKKVRSILGKKKK